MSAKAVLGRSMVAAALGAAIGYGFGAATSPLAPTAAPSPRDPALAIALGEIAERLAAIERTRAEPAMTMRQPAGQPDTDASLPTEAAEALFERLEAIARDLAILQADRAHETLRRTREQNPQPHEAAVRLLHAALGAEEELAFAQRSTRREWTLRTMAEVVARLGMPTVVFAGGTGPVWEYHFDEEEVTVHFRDGLVVEIKN